MWSRKGFKPAAGNIFEFRSALGAGFDRSHLQPKGTARTAIRRQVSHDQKMAFHFLDIKILKNSKIFGIHQRMA